MFRSKVPSVVLAAFKSVLFVACSSSNEPVTQSFEVYTELVSGSAVPIIHGGTVQVDDEGEFVDSVRIDSVRVLFSRLILHRSKDDTVPGPRNVKAGPLVVTWSAKGMRRDVGADIEPGTYRRLKMEMHTFSGSEAAQYVGHPVFGDFASDKRSTMIIDGVAFVAGKAEAFRIASRKTSNVFVAFDPPAQITESGTQGVVLSMDMASRFKVSGGIRNPKLPKALEALEDALESAISFRKK